MSVILGDHLFIVSLGRMVIKYCVRQDSTTLHSSVINLGMQLVFCDRDYILRYCGVNLKHHT